MPYAAVYTGADCLENAKADSMEGKVSRASATNTKREIKAFWKSESPPFITRRSIISAFTGKCRKYLGEANGFAIGLYEKDGSGKYFGVAVCGKAIVHGHGRWRWKEGKKPDGLDAPLSGGLHGFDIDSDFEDEDDFLLEFDKSLPCLPGEGSNEGDDETTLTGSKHPAMIAYKASKAGKRKASEIAEI